MKRLVLLAALLATPVLAQRAAPRGPSAPPEAAERYHEAARLYVDGQNVPALAAAEAVVALAPDDARAVALRDLIKKKQDQQNQQDQGDQPPPDDGQPPPPDDGDEDENPGQDGQNPPPGGQQPGPQNPGGKSEMSPEQAQRILDAVGGDERLLLRQMRRPPSRVRTNEEDW